MALWRRIRATAPQFVTVWPRGPPQRRYLQRALGPRASLALVAIASPVALAKWHPWGRASADAPVPQRRLGVPLPGGTRPVSARVCVAAYRAFVRSVPVDPIREGRAY